MSNESGRKVLITTKNGTGWSTWNFNIAQFLAEHPLLIELREEGIKYDLGQSKFRTNESTWSRVQRQKDPRFVTFFLQLAEYLDEKPEDIFIFWEGFNNTRVVTAAAPYRIDRYNGAEIIRERKKQEPWWY
jgi:hypothetical protein